MYKTYHVTAAIIKKDDKILIARRGQDKHLAGMWEFPGGKIEIGEIPEDCLKREIQEELGIVINVGDFFMQNDHLYGDRLIKLYSYFCQHISGEIKLNDHDMFEWVNRSQLLQYNFAPADIPFIHKLHAK